MERPAPDMVSGEPEIERVRSFIAIEIPEDVKQRLSALAASLRRTGVRASWVREPGYHLSLRFLGDISRDERCRIEAELLQSCANVPSFKVEIVGWGAFPNARAPRVLWAGVSGELDGLFALAQHAENAARAAGLDAVHKRFKPHVTLARIRDRAQNVARVLQDQADFVGGALPVERVSLFASELRPTGAKHTVLKSFDLGIPE